MPMVNGAVKVHTIGDSTMAEYDENTTDKRGWGMYLGSFFDPAFVTVNNRGKSGADTRSFYTQAAYWPSVKNQMSAGDYLRLFIDEARALGVNPILVGPICRKYFSGNTIRRNGQHDLGDKFSKIENGVLYENQSVPASDLSMSYVEAMRIVAEEKGVPFIDLTAATRDMYLEYGEAQCTQLLFCTGDNTHTNAMGGNLIARQAAQMMKEAGILAEYITIPTSITANPTSIAIGETYSGVAQNKEFLLTGFGLEPASGTVELNATGALTISTDKENYSKTLSVNYAGSTLFQKIYVRASYENEGENNDSIVITSGEAHLSVPVSASVISLAGGSAVSATWAINAKPVPEAVVSGPISAAFTMSYMMAADVKSEFSDGTANDIAMVRFHNADASGAKTAWPAGEIDENASRYLDFAITAPATMEVRITSISMDIASHSTSTMCYHINTGFGEGFTDVKTIAEKVNMTNKAIEHLEITPTLTIAAGETLHVRILPWHDLGESKSGKYICVKNVVIEGQAFEPVQGNLTPTLPSREGVKILRDGVLLIERNGVVYNAQGVEVRAGRTAHVERH